MYNDFLFEKTDNGVGVLTINKPRSMNVLSSDTLLEFVKIMTEDIPGENLRALIITGAGNKAFVAGADIRQMREMDKEKFEQYTVAGRRVFDYLQHAPFAVIAAINGYALGGGLELALACDIRMAASGSRMGFPETKLGLYPCWGGTQRGARLIGPGRTKKLIFTGEMVTATEAFSIGLVEQVVDQEKLMEEAGAIASQIAANSPLAVSSAKNVINAGLDMDLSSGLDYEFERGLECFDSYDRVEGMSAFTEKRTAKFRGE